MIRPAVSRFSAVFFGMVFLSGCAPVLIGAGAVGGYAVSKDSVTDYFETSQDRLFDAAVAVLQQKGAVNLQDRQMGAIEAEVEQSKVKVRLEKVTDGTVKVTIKARNQLLLPNISLAQDIYTALVKAL